VVHHSIGLFWCGQTFNGSCQGIPDPAGNLEADLGFVYSPASFLSQSPPQTSWSDFTDTTAWTGIIREQAAKALAAAFVKVPVLTPKHASPLGYPYSGVPDYVVNIVDGLLLPSMDSKPDTLGLTIANTGFCEHFGLFCSWNSVAYYSKIMFAAQTADASFNSPVYPPVTDAQKTAFSHLLVAIGNGIGNVAAHEIGHQLRLPDMDCDQCEAPPIGFNYDAAAAEPAFYLDVGPPLHWTSTDLNILNQELLKKK
jgi:hypothetical protein